MTLIYTIGKLNEAKILEAPHYYYNQQACVLGEKAEGRNARVPQLLRKAFRAVQGHGAHHAPFSYTLGAERSLPIPLHRIQSQTIQHGRCGGHKQGTLGAHI
jgi:hypothetical protein